MTFEGRSISTLITFTDEHKEEFTALIRELKNSFRPDGYQLSVTINPNVNNSLYLDVAATVHNFDWINLAVFDVQTPERNKKEVDFPAVSFGIVFEINVKAFSSSSAVIRAK